MENHNVFAGAFVDRSGERRKDSDWIAAAIESDESWFVPVWGEQCLVTGDPPQMLLLAREAVSDCMDEHELIFLGLFRQRPAFAFAIEGAEPPFAGQGEFHD